MSDDNSTTRRGFLRGASVGAGMLLAGSGAALAQAPAPVARKDRLPREIWVGTLDIDNLKPETPELAVRQILKRAESMVPYQPDIICLPEIFPYMNTVKNPSVAECAEVPPGATTRPCAEFAKKHQCYLVAPTYTKERGKCYNSAVVIDRQGKVVGEYRKMRPTVGEMEKGVACGPPDPPVFETDFGKVGVQICFDVNWREGWLALKEKGAEVVFWPSAFAGGRMLNALAISHKFNVVTSTRQNPARIIDLTGEEVGTTGRYGRVVCAPINLETVIVHGWPYVKSLDAFRAKYGRRMPIRVLHDEGWIVVESRDPNVKVRDALAEFDIPPHAEHLLKAQRLHEKQR